MSRAWIFQANPTMYDIDAALNVLDEIWWRTPQHPTEVRTGDIAVLWRSGPDAGIVGAGRVVEPPQLRTMDDRERAFVLDQAEDAATTTRTLLSLRAVPFVSKDRLRELPNLGLHRIVTAPMGTVFPLSDIEWAELSTCLPDVPTIDAPAAPGFPIPFAWEQRAKGIMPMPGGYDGYLRSARRVCEIVDDVRPTSVELVARMCEEFDLREPASRLRESFLRRMGLFILENGSLAISYEARGWLMTDDDRLLISLLHSRCQFIGEMIAELRRPVTTDELLSVVNDSYGIAWDSKTQITNRRGWLQSAGMITIDSDHRLTATERGRRFVDELILHEPSARPPERPREPPPPLPPPAPSNDPVALAITTSVDVLVAEIETAATDSGHPDRFERAVRDAFAFLGFEAELLGGSGRTDVLLEAPLSRHESYKVTVDAKTTGSGTLNDQQVDWTTLVEHRLRHDADHTLLVGPSPSAGRLMDRAQAHDVAVLSARQLAGLCRQHARSPLGLLAYRSLFTIGGEVDSADIDELADEGIRLRQVAGDICRTLAEKCPTFGRLNARDLWLMLAGADPERTGTVDEIQSMLDMLAHPLVAAVEGDLVAGYVLATSVDVSRARLDLLGSTLTGST